MSRYSGGAANGTEERLDDVNARLGRLTELQEAGNTLLAEIRDALKLSRPAITPRVALPPAKATKPRL
jgi:hypothetical protein